MKTVYLGVASAFALFGTAALPAAPLQPPRSQDAAWHNRQVLYVVRLKREDGWQVEPSGLRWRRIKGDGSGRHPNPSDTVTIHYAGRFIDGTEFDSSIARGTPAIFPLTRLIAGWQQGVPLAGIGDTIEIVLPHNLGYGPKGKGPIPGGATLIFTIELLGIGAAAAGAS